MAEDTGQHESLIDGYAGEGTIAFQGDPHQTFQRMADGGVLIHDGDHEYAPNEYTEAQWLQIVAAMSKTGPTELSLNSAALVHRGTAEIGVQVFGEAVARLSLRMATGREQQKPQLVQAKKLPFQRAGKKLILPR